MVVQLKAQFNHFKSRGLAWFLVNCLTLVGFFAAAPYLGGFVMTHLFKDCVTSDIDQDGVPYGFFNWVPLEKDEECDVFFVPSGHKSPRSMFMLSFVLTSSWITPLLMSLAWVPIYVAKHPFFEQYKI